MSCCGLSSKNIREVIEEPAKILQIPILTKLDIENKYFTNNPIGNGVSLKKSKENFFDKKARIISNENKLKLIQKEDDRQICNEDTTLYQVDDNIFNEQGFSLDVGLGFSKFSYMLGVNKDTVKERENSSLLLKVDNKYVLAKTFINLKTGGIWELTTGNFKHDVKKLYKSGSKKAFNQFINKYGTHMITRCDYGYRFRKVFQTKYDSNTSINDFKLDSKLRIMEYVKMDMSYTSKKVSNYKVESKENNVLILGDKANVLNRMRGSPLGFDWKTDIVYDSEMIDVYPEYFIPIYQIIPPVYKDLKRKLKEITNDIEYELANGWVQEHTYCCVHLTADPKIYAGPFMFNLELGYSDNYQTTDEDKHRIILSSARLQTHHIEFINQEVRPISITVNSNKWSRIDINRDLHLKMYYKDEKTYYANIENFNIFVPVDQNNDIRKYELNWKEIPLDELVKIHPGENFLN